MTNKKYYVVDKDTWEPVFSGAEYNSYEEAKFHMEDIKTDDTYDEDFQTMDTMILSKNEDETGITIFELREQLDKLIKSWKWYNKIFANVNGNIPEPENPEDISCASSILSLDSIYEWIDWDDGRVFLELKDHGEESIWA